MQDDFTAEQYDENAFHVEPVPLEEIQALEAELARQNPPDDTAVHPAKLPLFQMLFERAVTERDPSDTVLRDFARHVVGPLSDRLGMAAAKGGAFFRQKEQEGAANTQRYQRDQTMRAHLINGMLPALHIARNLAKWGAPPLRDWDETAERLFIAGYMLHDYTKIEAVKQDLHAAGFTENEAPSYDQISALARILVDWCAVFGLDDFLAPIGGAQQLAHDLIYVVHNTQQLWGTLHATSSLPDLSTAPNILKVATQVSHLADLLAYVARTPRELVAHDSIKKAMAGLAVDINLLAKTGQIGSRQVGRLVYHHVAENRGLLLNFIHTAILDALTIDDQRIPLLYAPSGVVYLERHTAPPMPELSELIPTVVEQVRSKAGAKLIRTGKGAKRGNTFIQVDSSYNDFFDLRRFIMESTKLVERYVVNNLSPKRIQPIIDKGWPGASNIPSLPTAPKDIRLDALAEWLTLMDVQLRERLPEFTFASWAIDQFEFNDLRQEFEALKNFPDAKKGGINYWWFWAAAHVLNRKSTLDPAGMLQWLENLSTKLSNALPEELPASARVVEDKWHDLADYISQVLTIGGIKAEHATPSAQELNRYVHAKAGRGGAICAICGNKYDTRRPNETAVSFQPGVYTARISIGGANNARSLCSICALEQLLRQLFVENLDSGGTVEGQRVRYLSFYPSYFFTPETLHLMRNVYQQIKEVRLSEKDLRQAINFQTLPPAGLNGAESAKWLAQKGLRDASFWQRLDPFLLRDYDDEPSKRVLRYSEDVQPTFLMVGLRNFNDPIDTESWVLPAFFSLVLPLCLDVKVVVSESSVPLILESDELPETVWFDGAHPAVNALIGSSRLNVDEVRDALARLTAAYLIHLDSEYEPPKENWQRFAPIAHSLVESPLYVFNHLKKQERDGDGQSVGPERVRRYVMFAESIFNPQGDPLMSHAKKLVELYRGFYRAKGISNSNSILRPLNVVADALLNADIRLFPDAESLVELTYGELYRFMDRVSKGLADGRFPKGISVPERDQAMRDFCQKFVNDVFIGVFNRDVAALRGKQLNLLKSACEVLYRDAQRIAWAERGRDTEEVEDADAEEAQA